MSEKKDYELKEGESYLSINIDAVKLITECIKAISKGDDKINLPAYKNESDNPQAPKYKSNMVAVWINQKKSKQVKEELIN